MDILPNLGPDLQFHRLGPSEGEIRYAFEVKKAALGPHIEKRWGWDEAFQFAFHLKRYAERPFFKIMYRGAAIGVVSVLQAPDHIRFGEFYIFPEYQSRGLGTKILHHVLAMARTSAIPVRLEYLKWNPVGSLYLRNGFQVTHETEAHYFLEWRPTESA